MASTAADIRLKGLSTEEIWQIIPQDTVILGYRGSISHGMYDQDADGIDDKDVLGVCIGPIDCYFGFNKFEQRETFLREWDVVVYEYRKMVRLLTAANPNVLNLLWLEPNHYIYRTPAGQRLIDNRHLFSSKRIYHAFVGYGHGQIKKMTNWGDERFTTGHMGAKRKAMAEALGYDAKNAATLVRLLRMGIEFLREGRLHVQRPDAKQLMEIKLGHWSLERVKEEAEHLFRRAEAAYDACTLPTEPDVEAIRVLMIDTLRTHFREKDI